MNYRVIDLNIIRSMPANHRQLTVDGNLVVPEIIGHEIATTTNGESTSNHLYQKLRALCGMASGRIYVGKHSAMMIKEQTKISQYVCGGSCINESSSRFLQEPYISDESRWVDGMKFEREKPSNSITTGKKYLDWLGKTFKSWAEKRDPDWVKEIKTKPDRRSQIIAEDSMDPEVISTFLRITLEVTTNDKWVWSKRYENPDWIRAISENPNKYPIGRMIRQYFYFASLSAAGVNENRLKNTVEDMEYIFLASYLGCIVTEDKEMQRCVGSLWPSVEIIGLDSFWGHTY